MVKVQNEKNEKEEKDATSYGTFFQFTLLEAKKCVCVCLLACLGAVDQSDKSNWCRKRSKSGPMMKSDKLKSSFGENEGKRGERELSLKVERIKSWFFIAVKVKKKFF